MQAIGNHNRSHRKQPLPGVRVPEASLLGGAGAGAGSGNERCRARMVSGRPARQS